MRLLAKLKFCRHFLRLQLCSSKPCECFYLGRVYLRWYILLVIAKCLALSAAQTAG